jgi:cyclopropane-fatty-acyl-phospholipid synthase
MLDSLDRSRLFTGETAEARRRPAPELLIRQLVGASTVGGLLVELPYQRAFSIGGDRPGAHADITVRRWRAIGRMLSGGDIGFAEAYRDGDWETSDLNALLSWAMQNEEALNSFNGSAPIRVISRLRHRLRANTRANSRRNIASHYDLGNEFYAAWLDGDLNYSSGLYARPDVTLAAAQTAKIDRVMALLDLKGGERVLEIGCGWGALAERLIATHGCHVTAVTLSERQREYADERLRRSGLNTFADIRLQDYRDLGGTFDRVVSVEMLEAVGEDYWPLYFAKLRTCLSPGGRAVLQVISIDPARFEAYRRRPDFIQTHIFPGGMLPTPGIIREQASRAGLSLNLAETFAPSYALTLADWRARFNRAWPVIASLGFDQPFQRLWNYYLVYCEVGFESGALNVGLYQLDRPF